MKAVIILGKENEIESYSLLIKNKYISRDYNCLTENYQEFIDEISSNFARIITNTEGSLEVGVLNRVKIEDRKIKKVEKLKTDLFDLNLQNKIIKQTGKSKMIFPATNIN